MGPDPAAIRISFGSMESPTMTRRVGFFAALLFVLGWMPVAANAAIGSRSLDGVWSESPATATVTDASAGTRRFQLDDFALFRVLRGAPLEFTSEARTAPVVLTLPLPDGRYSRF